MIIGKVVPYLLQAGKRIGAQLAGNATVTNATAAVRCLLPTADF